MRHTQKSLYAVGFSIRVSRLSTSVIAGSAWRNEIIYVERNCSVCEPILGQWHAVSGGTVGLYGTEVSSEQGQ